MSKHRRKRAATLRAEAAAIERRLERAVVPNVAGPLLERANIAYELSARTKGTAHGAIGAIAKLIGATGLAGEIDCSLELLKVAQALLRVRPCLEHRLQRAVRGAAPRGHRGASL